MIMYLEQTQRSHAIKTNCCFIDFNSGQKKDHTYMENIFWLVR